MGVKIPMLSKRFGKLTVIEQSAPDTKGAYRWLCKCDCGNKLIVNGGNLRGGHSKSCGCLKLEIWTKRKQPVAKECLNCIQKFQPYCGADKYCKLCSVDIRRQRHRINVRASRDKNKDHYRRVKANWDLKKYGLTLDIYKIMLHQQNYKCAICLSDSKNHRGILRPLAVDHCHKTNKVRGLLCSYCNTALGLLNEDKNIFFAAINYLEKFRNERYDKLAEAL